MAAFDRAVSTAALLHPRRLGATRIVVVAAS
jgi:hypothetical protein